MPFLKLTSKITKVKPVVEDVKKVTNVNGLVEDVNEVSSKDEDVDYTFATETSLHGVGIIARAENVLVKTIWTVILLGLVGVLTWQIVQLFVEFAKFTPVTEVKVEVIIALTFYT